MHWGYGATGGAVFAALPDPIKKRAWFGPIYGVLLWAGFEFVQAPLMDLKQAKRLRLLERPALIARPPALRPGAVGDPAAPPGLDGSARRAPAGAGTGHGHGAGRGLSPPRPPPGRRAGAGRATCSTTSAACCARPRGRPDAVAGFVERLASDAPPLAVVEDVAAEEVAPTGAGRLRDRGERARRRAAGARLARRGHLRGVPGRAVRPRRPPPPLPVHQLHRLRPALHDRARGAVRPPAHHDGGLRDVRAVPRRVRGPGRPPLPRPAERVPGVRAPLRC